MYAPRLLLLAALLTCAGCTNQSQHNAEAVGDYFWNITSIDGRSASALEARTRLAFKDNHIYISGTCNNAAGNAVFTHQKLSISHLHSTLMACDNEDLMSHEQYLTDWLAEASSWSLSAAKSGAAPRLTLRQTSGSTIQLRGEPTPEKRYGSLPDTIFMEIQPQKVACNHPLMPNASCLKVRTISYNKQGIKTAQGEWQYFYDEIQGYEHHEDTRVVLRVKRYAIANPPADASAFAYIHDLTVEQEFLSH